MFLELTPLHNMSKFMKIVMIVLLVVIIFIFAAGIIVGNIFFNLALNPESDKDSVLSADHNVLEKVPGEEDISWGERTKINTKWLADVTYEDVYMDSQDNLRLHGLEVSNETDSHLWFIGCHGYTGDCHGMLGAGRKFYEQGFHLLMPDARGHGDSEGDYIGMGWDERLDIVDWIQRIVEKDPEAQIVLYGVSMGGATVMMVSGEEMPDNVKAIVEDCGYGSIWDVFSYQLTQTFHLPTFPIMHFSSLVTKVRAGFWLGDGNAIKQVEKSVTPILFIHGENDTFVPFEMLDTIYEAATCPKEKLIVEGAGHGMSQYYEEEKYWETIQSFLEEHMDSND